LDLNSQISSKILKFLIKKKFNPIKFPLQNDIVEVKISIVGVVHLGKRQMMMHNLVYHLFFFDPNIFLSHILLKASTVPSFTKGFSTQRKIK